MLEPELYLAIYIPKLGNSCAVSSSRISCLYVDNKIDAANYLKQGYRVFSLRYLPEIISCDLKLKDDE